MLASGDGATLFVYREPDRSESHEIFPTWRSSVQCPHGTLLYGRLIKWSAFKRARNTRWW